MAVLRKLEAMDECTQQAFAEEFARKKKSPVLGFFLTNIGMHYAYVGRVWLTLLFLISYGGFCIWWFIDLFRVTAMVKEYNRTIAIQVLRDIQILN
jgi:hypothetical protein